MMSAASPVIQIAKLGNLKREVFPNTRYFQFHDYQANRSDRTYGVRICCPRQLRFCQSEPVESWVDESLNFRTVPQSLCVAEKEEAKAVLSPSSKKRRAQKLRAMTRVSEIGSDGQPHPLVLYLIDLGMDMDQIKSIARRYPQFVCSRLEGKIKPKMTYLENLGVDKKKWAKLIYRFPLLLMCSREKVKSIVDFFYELGLTAESVGKNITRYPQIVCCNVEENLRPTAEYFSSLGVDVAVLVHRAPQVLCLSIEKKLKPIFSWK